MPSRIFYRRPAPRTRGQLPAGLALLAAVAYAVSTPLSGFASEHDPFEIEAASDPDPFEEFQVSAPLSEEAYYPRQPKVFPLQINFQIPPAADAATDPQPPVEKAPCAAAVEKPLADLGVNIGLPSGQLPADHAAACWDSMNQQRGPLAAARFWHGFVYQWDATALCHRPLYFEEVNLERYGYGCCACLQPAASAAHFFATVPALPYCMAAECPQECVYTLGHYRPGSCPPWRCHWPPSDPLAAAAQGGVLTGLIFLIP